MAQLTVRLTAPFTRVAVFTDRGYYGVGATIAEATKELTKVGAGRTPLRRGVAWLVYAVTEQTEVQPGSGSFLTRPTADGEYVQPRLLARVAENGAIEVACE